VTWIMKSLVQYTDAEGNVDYGNIDEFFGMVSARVWHITCP